MRPRSWLLLSCLLLSVPAFAREGLGGPALRKRTLVAPSRPAQVPPLELHVASGTATLVQLDATLKGAPRLPDGETRIQLLPVGADSWVLVPTTPLSEGEQVPLTVETAPGSEPLRFLLVTRLGEVDAQVRVVPAPDSAEEDAAETLALHLFDTPEVRVTLALPQEVMRLHSEHSRAQVDSVLWMGRRLFAIVSARGRGKGARPWRLVQARLRATLADDSLLEWPARLVSGKSKAGRRHHVFTSLLPEGASHLELALDGEDTPGVFKPLPEEGPVSP